MSDRICGFVVTLEKDLKDEDAEVIRTALEMIRCVESVKPLVADYELHIATERVRMELGTKLWEILYPKEGK